jgi:hypothetical protein
MMAVWNSLFRIDVERAIPAMQAWLAILLYCAVCLALLLRKVRAYEVVR